MERVILVNNDDRKIGLAEKEEAHKAGLLHRAFSVLIYNGSGEMLIQKRAEAKYHGGGLWSNACCSHPRDHEKVSEAIRRRVQEELGINCSCRFLFKVQYDFDMKNGLREKELDHVYMGKSKDEPKPDLREVEDWKFISTAELDQWMKERPDDFTPWFRLISSQIEKENFLAP
jgi:isopentenyl-diphosphate Delta-isomerase